MKQLSKDIASRPYFCGRGGHHHKRNVGSKKGRSPDFVRTKEGFKRLNPSLGWHWREESKAGLAGLGLFDEPQ